MSAHPSPPFDPWLWTRAWSETWLAGLHRATALRLQAQRLERLIASTLRGSPFYRHRHPGARGLADFAPVSKAELMEHFDDWSTDRRVTLAAAEAFTADSSGLADAWLDNYLVWTSSGTSGEPGLFVQDKQSLAAYDAIDSLRLRGAGAMQAMQGMWALAQRFAFVGATGGHFAGHVSVERLRRLAPAAVGPTIRVFSVLDPLQRVANDLQRLQPTVLITYPSCAAALAQMQHDGAIHLLLSEVWLGGEQHSAEQRKLISAAFGCAVRNNYGASEFFSIAWECPEGRLHLNDDWLILEPVDDRLQAVPTGTPSHSALLTHLANLTQPLLRYRLDDRVRLLGEPCPCGSGFPVIEVDGRSNDTLVMHDSRHRPVTILPLALVTAIEEGAQVTQFQLLLGKGDSLELRFEATVNDAEAAFGRCRGVLEVFLARHGVKPTRISFSHAAPRHQPVSGKLCRVLNAPEPG
jgi:phenylacetate-CoA ligase